MPCNVGCHASCRVPRHDSWRYVECSPWLYDCLSYSIAIAYFGIIIDFEDEYMDNPAMHPDEQPNRADGHNSPGAVCASSNCQAPTTRDIERGSETSKKTPNSSCSVWCLDCLGTMLTLFCADLDVAVRSIVVRSDLAVVGMLCRCNLDAFATGYSIG